MGSPDTSNAQDACCWRRCRCSFCFPSIKGGMSPLALLVDWLSQAWVSAVWTQVGASAALRPLDVAKSLQTSLTPTLPSGVALAVAAPGFLNFALGPSIPGPSPRSSVVPPPPPLAKRARRQRAPRSSSEKTAPPPPRRTRTVKEPAPRQNRLFVDMVPARFEEDSFQLYKKYQVGGGVAVRGLM